MVVLNCEIEDLFPGGWNGEPIPCPSGVFCPGGVANLDTSAVDGPTMCAKGTYN